MTITPPEAPRYPDAWPKPQISGHGGEINAGLERSPQQGFPQQYRFIPTAPTRMTLTFRIALSEWPQWLAWVNSYGITRWCLLPCVDQYQSIDPTPTYDWSIARFVGRIRTVPVGELYVDAQCEVDLWPEAIGVAKPGTIFPGGGGSFGLPSNLLECQPYACDALEVAIPGWANLIFEDSPPTPNDVFPAGNTDIPTESWSLPNYGIVTFSGSDPYEPCFDKNFAFAKSTGSLNRMIDGGGLSGEDIYFFAVHQVSDSGWGRFTIRADKTLRDTDKATSRATVRRVIVEQTGADQLRVGIEAIVDGGDGPSATVWSDAVDYDEQYVALAAAVTLDAGPTTFLDGNSWKYSLTNTITATLMYRTTAGVFNTLTISASGDYVAATGNVLNGDSAATLVDESDYFYFERQSGPVAGIYVSPTPLAVDGFFLAWQRNRLDYTPPFYCS